MIGNAFLFAIARHVKKTLWRVEASTPIIPTKKQPFKKERLNSNKTKQEKKLSPKHDFNDVAGKANFYIIDYTKKLVFPMLGLPRCLQYNVIMVRAFSIPR